MPSPLLSAMDSVHHKLMQRAKGWASQLSPRASIQGWKSFGDRQDVRRCLVALPLLGLCIVASNIMAVAPAAPFARMLLKEDNIVWDGGWRSVPILRTFYNLPWLDDIISLANMFFMPSVYGYDAGARTQVLSFLSDGGVVLAIWWLESLRQGEKPLYLRYPSIIAMTGQVIGLGVVCPFYCLLSYIHAPSTGLVIEPSQSSAIALLPALILGFYIPTYATLLWPDLYERQGWLFVWQLFPAYISLAYHAISYLLSHADKTKSKKTSSEQAASPTSLQKLNHDLLVMRLCIGFSVLIGATSWIWTLYKTGSFAALADIFLPTANPGRLLPDLTAFSVQFLRWDEVFVFGSKLAWLAYLYADVKRSSQLQHVSWLGLISCAALTMISLGPGATVGLGWLWREEMLAKRLERDALKLEVQAKVDALLKAHGA